MKNSKKIIVAILIVFLIILIFYKEKQENDFKENNNVVDAFENDNFEYNKTILDFQPIIVTDEVQGIADNTIEATYDGEDVSTTEIIESSEEEEQDVFDEGALEEDAIIEQENISYNGDSTGSGLSLLGAYQGLTYYSQADSRWANILYSSTGDYSQTMKSSACGPTSAAMIISSSKGAILPTTLANLAISNGYRTANSGTAWAFYPFIADYFNFKEYYTTPNFETAMNYLKTDNNNDGVADYFIITSCGSGLFTTGGHYIALVADDGGTITVYDPYLYSGKFNTVSRRNAGVVVSGNSAFVSEKSFKEYANYKYFWIYSNDSTQSSKNIDNNLNDLNYKRYVATQSSDLNVRDNPNGNRITTLKKGTEVNVVETSGGWSRINSPVNGWVSNSYLSSTPVNNNIQNTVGSYYRLKIKSTLYSNSNLTGTGYNYLANTQVKILENITETIDKVQVVKTGRVAFINNSAYAISGVTSQVKNTVGKLYRLKNKTTIYSNSKMNGTSFNYLAQTQIKVLSNYNDSIDYVQVIKTGRRGYVYTKNYK